MCNMKNAQKKDLTFFHDIFDILVGDLEFKDITQKIVDIIADNMNAIGALLFLIDEDKKNIRLYSLAKSSIINEMIKLLSKGFGKYQLSLNGSEGNYIGQTAIQKKIHIDKDIRKFICPPIDEKSAEKVLEFTGVKCSIALPVVFKEEVLGVLFVSFKEEEISQEKIDLLNLFTKYVGISLHKALNFSVLKKQNVHLQKLLEMRSEFLGIASHQLRTPITVINGYISMLADDDCGEISDVERMEIYMALRNKAKKLNQIVNDILYASALDSGTFKLHEKEMKTFDIVSFVQKIVDGYRLESKEKNVMLELTEKDEGTVNIHGSERYLEIVLDNLIANAVHYTPSGGSVSVHITVNSGRVRVSIIDTGIGIPKEDQKDIFAKFKRAQNSKKEYTDGSGLGLFIVEQLVKAHPKGKVGFESELDAGSTFWIEFDIVKPAS